MCAIFVPSTEGKNMPENARMESNTLAAFDMYLDKCLDIFLKKNADYGTSWRVLRPSSLTDQVLIKASRIRSIQSKGEQKVNDPLELEFYGLINYSVMALIQLEHGVGEMAGDLTSLKEHYKAQVKIARKLLENKNHDYGEVWRLMRLSSIVDIILMKIHRIKSIEENKGVTLVSEGVDANFLDIINYSVFALIKLEEQK